MFGKKNKSSKGKATGNLLGRFKSRDVKKTDAAGDDAGFNPMDLAARPLTEEERIDANLGDLSEVLEQELAAEMQVEHDQNIVENTALLQTNDEGVAEIGDVSGIDTDVAPEPDEAAPTTDEPVVVSDEVLSHADNSAELSAGTLALREALSVKDAVELLFDPIVEPAPPISLEKPPVVEVKPELKPVFRSDGQAVKIGRLGRFLYDNKLVNGDALDAVYRMQEVTGKPIGQHLVANGFLTDKQRTKAILKVEESRISQEQVSRARIPVNILDENSIIISAEHDDTIFVASPHDEALIEPIVAEYYPEKKIEFVSYDPSSMSRFITTMRRSASVEDIRETKETMLDRIVYKALEKNASDIHIFPLTDCYVVQFRIDGILRIIHMGPLDEYHTVMAQVKDKATIDLAEKRKSQDGAYQVEYNGKMIDLRVSTLPVQSGEHVTIRVLDSDRVHPNLDTLGIAEVQKWRRGFKQRSGICVISGATGSGKTTTLNSSLRELDRFGKRIFTVEDPVEYRIPFVGQVSTNASVGLDFAAALKAFMRNDPDIIVLGEVRTAEAARNAIQAADTGHLVLITLHTSSVMSAISRLKDLGIEPRELRYMLRAILVQHLIPTLCTVCHGDDPDCLVCKGQRYVGRTVVSECEYFENVKDVDRLLNARNETVSSEERTWLTMAEDAVNKMRSGVTDVAGLERTFGSEIYPYLNEEELKQCSNL